MILLQPITTAQTVAILANIAKADLPIIGATFELFDSYSGNVLTTTADIVADGFKQQTDLIIPGLVNERQYQLTVTTIITEGGGDTTIFRDDVPVTDVLLNQDENAGGNPVLGELNINPSKMPGDSWAGFSSITVPITDPYWINVSVGETILLWGDDANWAVFTVSAKTSIEGNTLFSIAHGNVGIETLGVVPSTFNIYRIASINRWLETLNGVDVTTTILKDSVYVSGQLEVTGNNEQRLASTESYTINNGEHVIFNDTQPADSRDTQRKVIFNDIK